MVVDDASTDGTAERLRERYGNAITLLVNPGNREKSYSRNRGLRESDADYVGYLDSDDLIFPDSVERRLEIFREDPGFRGVAFGLRAGRSPQPADPTAATIKRGESIGVDDYLEDRHWLHANAILAPRDVMLEHGLFNEDMRNLEDCELFIRLLVACELRFCGSVVTEVLSHAVNRVRHNWDNIIAQPDMLSTAIEGRPELVAALGAERLRTIRQSEREDLLLALYRSKRFAQYRRCYRDGVATQTSPRGFRFRKRHAISLLRGLFVVKR